MHGQPPTRGPLDGHGVSNGNSPIRSTTLQWQTKPDTNLLAHLPRLSQGCSRLTLRGVFAGISVLDGVSGESHQGPTQLFQRGVVWHQKQEKILQSMYLGEGDPTFGEQGLQVLFRRLLAVKTNQIMIPVTGAS